MNKSKFSLRQLFSNTKFLVVFSIVVAIIFWIIVALEYAPVVENTVKNVPVVIEMENSVPDKLGLQIFGKKDFTVDITVRGNRYDIGGDLISPSDFDVTAQTAYVDSSGSHTLKIKVVAKNSDAEFSIIGCSQEYIEVYFDRFEEKEFKVLPRIETDLESITADEYVFYPDDIIFTTKTVTLSGAKTELDRIQNVYADIPVKTSLRKSETVDASVVPDNGTTYPAKYIKINDNDTLTIPVTLPVYKIETLPFSVIFKNAPPDYVENPVRYSCRPSTAKVAVMQTGDDIKSIELGPVDFKNISKSGNRFVFKTKDISNIKVLDNTQSVEVILDTDNFESKKFNLKKENITVINSADENISDIDISEINLKGVTVSGKLKHLNSVTVNEIAGKIDLKGIKVTADGTTVPVDIYLKNSKNCWVNGTYTVIVSKRGA